MAEGKSKDTLKKRKNDVESSSSIVADESERASKSSEAQVSAEVKVTQQLLQAELVQFASVRESHMKDFEDVMSKHDKECDRLSDAKLSSERDADNELMSSINKHLRLEGDRVSEHNVSVNDLDSSISIELSRLSREIKEHESNAVQLRSRVNESEKLLGTKKQRRASLAVEEASMLETLQSSYAKLEAEALSNFKNSFGLIESNKMSQVMELEGELASLGAETESCVAEKEKRQEELASMRRSASEALEARSERIQAKLASQQIGIRRLEMHCEELYTSFTAMHASAVDKFNSKRAAIEQKKLERQNYIAAQRLEIDAVMKETDGEVRKTLQQLDAHEHDLHSRLADVRNRMKSASTEMESLDRELSGAVSLREQMDVTVENCSVRLRSAMQLRDRCVKRTAIEKQRLDTDVADKEEQLRLVNEMVALERSSGGANGAMKADATSLAAKKRITAEDAARSRTDDARRRLAEAQAELEEGSVSLEMRGEAARRDLLSAEEAAEMELEKSTFEIAEHRRRASEALAAQLISVEQASKLASDKYENDMRQLGAQLERDYKSLLTKEAQECALLEQKRDDAMRNALKWLTQHKRGIEDGVAAAKYQRDAVQRRIVQELKDLESNIGKAALLREKLTDEIDFLQRSKLSSERSRASDLSVVAEYESRELAALAEDEAELVGEPTLGKLLEEIEPAMAYTASSEIGKRGELLSTVLDARGYDKLKEYGVESHASTLLATLRAVVRMEAANRDRRSTNDDNQVLSAHSAGVLSKTDELDESQAALLASGGSGAEWEELKMAVENAASENASDEQWRSERMAAILGIHNEHIEGLEQDREAASKRCSLKVAAAQAACNKSIEKLEAVKVALRAKVMDDDQLTSSSSPGSIEEKRRAAKESANKAMKSLDDEEVMVKGSVTAAESEYKRLAAAHRHEVDCVKTIVQDVEEAKKSLAEAKVNETKAQDLLDDESKRHLRKNVSGGRGRLAATGSAGRSKQQSGSINTVDTTPTSVAELDAMRREADRLTARVRSLEDRVKTASEHHQAAMTARNAASAALDAADRERKRVANDVEQRLKQLAGEKNACQEKLKLELANIDEEQSRLSKETAEMCEQRLTQEITDVDNSIEKEKLNLQVIVEELKAEMSNELVRLAECEKELQAKFTLENDNIKRESDRRKKVRSQQQKRAVKMLENSRANVTLEKRDEEERAKRALASLSSQMEYEWKLLLDREASAMRTLYASISERRTALAQRVEADRRTLEEGFAMTRWDADQSERSARGRLEALEEQERQSKAAMVALTLELDELRQREASAGSGLSAKLDDAVAEYSRMVNASRRQIESEAKDILSAEQLKALQRGFEAAEASVDSVMRKNMADLATMKPSGLYDYNNISTDMLNTTSMLMNTKTASGTIDFAKFEAEKAAAMIEIDAMERELRTM